MVYNDFALLNDKIYPTYISGYDLKLMFFFAFKKLEEYIDIINNINVFPVPDGDTGLNMYQTYKSIVNEIKGIKSNNCGEIIKYASKGAFSGCVGCSGIILTEYFHGLEKAWKNVEKIDINTLVEGLELGSKYSYLAVENPREGTILTITRIISESAKNWVKSFNNPYALLIFLYDKAKDALLETYKVLPEANKAGVVDAGAMGLVLSFEGFISAIDEKYNLNLNIKKIDEEIQLFLKPNLDPSRIRKEFELIISLINLSLPINKIKDDLSKEGNALFVIQDEISSRIKLHIHCREPKRILEKLKDYTDSLEILSLQAMDEQSYKLLKKLQIKPRGSII